MLYVGFVLTLIGLVVYSFSQIDLNLTLSSNSLYQSFQKPLIFLGYFNRPLSTFIYLAIICLLFIVYGVILYKVRKNELSVSNIVKLIIVSAIILIFAYPAFSHDLFNYMFDARIVTHYHLNPYFYKALDFPSDLWIRFMHWTHRTYPYGPVWLILTLPFSFLGLEKFTFTLLNFKLMFLLFHLGNIYLIYKILIKFTPKNSLLGMAFYAFNPLILIESLVSPHNEVTMLFFLLLSLYFLLIKKNIIFTVISLLVSFGIKFITIIFLPFIVYYYRSFKKISNFIRILKTCFILIVIPMIIEIIYREPYPWYFIMLIGLGSFLTDNGKILILIGGVSLGALLRYAPYLYQGGYPQEVIFAQTLVFIGSISISLSYIGLEEIRKRRKILMI